MAFFFVMRGMASFFVTRGMAFFFVMRGMAFFFVIPYFFSSERTFKSSYSSRGDFLLMIKSRSEPLQSQ